MGDGTALVASARSGDSGAREELAKLCLGSAYRLAFQLVGRRDEARDVAQDALLRFFSHLDRIDAGRPPLRWLCAIVRNRVRDGFRRGRERSGVESLGSAGFPPPGAGGLRHFHPGAALDADAPGLRAG